MLVNPFAFAIGAERISISQNSVTAQPMSQTRIA